MRRIILPDNNNLTKEKPMNKSKIVIIASIFLVCYCSASADKREPDTDISRNGPYEVSGDPLPKYDLSAESVYGFSQTANGSEDSQVYALSPDINMRAWQKWETAGIKESHFNKSYIAKCRSQKILFVAGGTASVVFETEAPDRETFLEWITRDSFGKPVLHSEIVPNAYRASMANPSYRKYLIQIMKVQIDAGVDGLFLDEANSGGYNGGPSHNYNGNEGYDDYSIADFNRYLMNKYPSYTASDWKSKFGMTDENIIRRDIAYDDLEYNFNYRKYLKEKGFSDYPRDAANPLAKEWGIPTANRIDSDDDSFSSSYMTLYWKEIVIALRNYARNKYSKEILITSNGIFPFTDFNSLGLYNYNTDDNGKEADYVPVVSGKLNGAKSLKNVYLSLYERSRKTSGNVPLVLFIDWPCEMMSNYYKLSAAQKKDFWRIYAAEAYSCGLYFAFHLRTVMPGDPTSTDSGILDFLKDYSSFYKTNGEVYEKSTNTGLSASLDKNGVMYNVTASSDKEKYYVHLVNHNYSSVISEQKNVSVNFRPDFVPSKISSLSPDGNADVLIPFTNSGGSVSFTVPELLYYKVVVVEK